MNTLDISQMVSTISTAVETNDEFNGTVPREVCNKFRAMKYIVICRDYPSNSYTICKDYKPLYDGRKNVDKYIVRVVLDHKLPSEVVEHYYYNKNIFIQQTSLPNGSWDCYLVRRDIETQREKDRLRELEEYRKLKESKEYEHRSDRRSSNHVESHDDYYDSGNDDDNTV